MLQPTSLSGASGVYVKPNENEYWAPDESSQTANRLHIGYVLTDLLNNSLNDIAASKTSLPPSRPNAWYFGCTINYEPQRPRSRENPSAEVSGYTP